MRFYLAIFCIVVFAAAIPVMLLTKDIARSERWSTVLFSLGAIGIVANVSDMVTSEAFRWAARAVFFPGAIWMFVDGHRRRKREKFARRSG